MGIKGYFKLLSPPNVFIGGPEMACLDSRQKHSGMTNGGQTAVEYIVLIGIITVALFYMGPLFKRGVQSLVKVTSDQIGGQQNAEQDFKDANDPGATGGYLVSSNTGVNSSVSKKVETPGWGGVADITVNETTNTTADSHTNLGKLNQ